MVQEHKTPISRRHLLRAGACAALTAGLSPRIISNPARAQQKTLRILQWKHFVPGYDAWFNDTFIKEWGQQNDTTVVVDNVGLGDIDGLATAEAAGRSGHDLVMFVAPPAKYEDQVIDHREIYEECERRYGRVADLATKSTYNPKTGKYFGFCQSYAPALLIYRKSLWDGVMSTPDTWEDVLAGGRRIRLLHGKPVGISLSPEHNSDMTLRAIMYSFGSMIQDVDSKPRLKSRETVEVLKYVKALYEQAMTEEVLTWDASSNNRFLLADEGCLTVDTLSIARAGENKRLAVANDLWLARLPAGPSGRLGPSFGFYTYCIWSFAANIEGAKQFLVDYTASSRQACLASGFQNMPSFPGAVPDLPQVLGNDAHATPPEKYSELADAATWTTNIGYPGYTNAAVDEIVSVGLIPMMCRSAVTGQRTPEQALDEADAEVRRIFAKWQEIGKV
jgi:multiple sugar transport system substrate-binding protein